MTIRHHLHWWALGLHHLHPSTGHLPRPSTPSAEFEMSRQNRKQLGRAYHFQQLVAFVQMCHDDALTLWHRAIDTDELAILPHGVDLM